MRVMRDAYELRELADFWCISNADIRCLVGQGRLKLCVRIVDEPAVQHVRNAPDGVEPFWA
jgi:hypothetical protein